MYIYWEKIQQFFNYEFTLVRVPDHNNKINVWLSVVDTCAKFYLIQAIGNATYNPKGVKKALK